MGVINMLPEDISIKIAAGEVVERPASIVKELVENSIDAGATAISVELENGGCTFLRVTDNGCGMGAEDAEMCFMRHATSKIRKSEDLDAISTLGFRGEAMASIAAVSDIQLTTKRVGDNIGTMVEFRGGELIASGEAGAATGTTVVVRDLFYNTPARLKFLKKDSTEANYISDIMTRFILSHPEISFRLIKNGKEQYFTPGDSSLQNALYSVYGRDYAKTAISVDYELDGIKVSGIIGRGESARANRTYQSFFINHRYVKSANLTHAAEEAYKNQIMIGKFPMLALNIDIDPHNIDINVHPTKLEVKFSDDRAVHSAVYHAVKNALYSVAYVPEIERTPEPENFSDEPQVIPRPAPSWKQVTMPAQSGGFSGYEKKPAPSGVKAESKPEPKPEPEPKPPLRYEKTPDLEYFHRKQQLISGIKQSSSEIQSDELPVRDSTEIPHAFRVIGQLFLTYILVEEDDSLLLIDQHAAHERLKYEELKRELKDRPISAQRLIIPIPVQLSPIEAEIFDDNVDKMSELGFEAEKNGDVYNITAVPSVMDEDEIVSLFVELLTAIGENREEVIGKAKERLTYTIACKAAVKANGRLTDIEMYSLVRDAFHMENINTCPHGRPIIIRMTKKEIEKEFGRIL